MTNALRFDRFFETSGDLLAVLSLEGRFLTANRAFWNVLGYTAQSLTGESLLSMVHEESAGAVRDALASLPGGGALRLDVSLLHRDHSVRRVHLHLRCVPEDEALYLTGRDATTASELETTARRATLLFDKLQSSGKLGGWELDCRTKELFWSAGTYTIHEVPPGFEPNLDGAIDFYAPEHVPVISEVVGACMTRGEPYDVVLQIVTWKKRRVWVRAAGAAVRENGEVTRIYGSFQDIDEEKRRELELLEKLAIIEEQRSEIQQLSAPIIQVWDGVLALPIVGQLDEARAADMTERLLGAVVTLGTDRVILDLTGVEEVDEATGDHLVRIFKALGLLGAQSIITGVRPAVAQTLVALGADLSRTPTRSTLRDAIKDVMRARR